MYTFLSQNSSVDISPVLVVIIQTDLCIGITPTDRGSNNTTINTPTIISTMQLLMRTHSRIPRGMNTRMVTLLALKVTHTLQCPMAISIMDLLRTDIQVCLQNLCK